MMRSQTSNSACSAGPIVLGIFVLLVAAEAQAEAGIAVMASDLVVPNDQVPGGTSNRLALVRVVASTNKSELQRCSWASYIACCNASTQ